MKGIMKMFSLTTTHLRFVCEATTPLRLEADTFRAGSNLRGALGQVMLRAYCTHPDPKGFAAYAAHGDTLLENPLGLCPVHWLLAANLKPGEERRGYTLVPPLPHETRECGDKDHRNAGDLFEFGLTLFGSAQQFLPYFILAVPEMGRMGIGPGRGKFELKRVWALNPLTGESEILFGDHGNLVRTPTLVMDHAGVKQIADSRWQMADGESLSFFDQERWNGRAAAGGDVEKRGSGKTTQRAGHVAAVPNVGVGIQHAVIDFDITVHKTGKGFPRQSHFFLGDGRFLHPFLQ